MVGLVCHLPDCLRIGNGAKNDVPSHFNRERRKVHPPEFWFIIIALEQASGVPVKERAVEKIRAD